MREGRKGHTEHASAVLRLTLLAVRLSLLIERDKGGCVNIQSSEGVELPPKPYFVVHDLHHVNGDSDS